MIGTATIIRADARTLPLDDASADLIITSPPYFGLRAYTDGGERYAGQLGSEPTPAAYIDNLIACTREMVRVLKPSGSIWVNLGDKFSQRVAARPSSHQDGLFPGRDDLIKDWKRDRAAGLARMPRENVIDPTTGTHVPEKSLMGLPWRYAIRCIDELGLILRAEVIWSKPNGLPESATDRVCRSHEQWFHFTLQPRYFAAVDEIREPSDPRNLRPADRDGRISAKDSTRRANGHGVIGHAGKPLEYNPLGRLPGSVWEIATQPLKVPAELGIDHFAAFPIQWPRRIILGWSPPRGTVLDPFGGTGSTALAAKALGRHGISVDLSADYCRLAEWRVNDPGELAKALGVEKPATQLDGQADILDLIREAS
jgi:DNA modification methylase